MLPDTLPSFWNGRRAGHLVGLESLVKQLFKQFKQFKQFNSNNSNNAA
jgi:hypothetical protein